MLTEEFELDPGRAEQQIDNLGDQLTQIAQNFRADLARAMTELDQQAVVDVTADADAVTPEVTQAVDAADTNVEVTGDASDLTGEVTSSVDAADTEVVITGEADELTGEVTASVEAADTNVVITGDASDLTGEITEAIDQAEQSAAFELNVDSSSLESLTEVGSAAAESIDEVASASAGSTESLVELGAVGGGVAQGLGRAFGVVAGVVGAGIGIQQLVELSKDAVNAASDLEESTSKVTVVFDEAAGSVLSFGENAATALGLSQQQALEAAGTFGNLFTALGLSTDQAAELSPEIVTLASDLASFNNLDPSETLEKLRSGLVGEIEPLRSLGVSFDAAAVEQKAFELGLADTADELTEADKVLARYNIVVEQTSNAQGDFARTSEGLANRQRILTASFQDLLAEAGQDLQVPVLDLIESVLPILETLVPAVTEVVAALLPLATAALDAAGPLADLFSDVLIQTAREFAPVIIEAGEALRRIAPSAEQLAPLLDQLIASGQGFAEVALLIVRVGGPLLDFFSALAIEAPGALEPITDFLSLGLNLGPVDGLIDGLGLLGSAFGGAGDEAEETATSVEVLQQKMFGTADTLEATAAAVSRFTGTFGRFLADASTFAEDVRLERSLENFGATSDQVLDDLSDLSIGFERFVAQGIRVGEIAVSIGGVQQTADDIARLDGNLGSLVATGEAVVTTGEDITFAFNQQQIAIEAASEAQFNDVVAAERLTDAQREAVLAYAESELGARSYTNAVQVLADVQEFRAAQAAAGLLLPLEEQRRAYETLAGAVLFGQVTQDNFAATTEGLAARLGVSSENIGQFVQFINERVAEVATSIGNNIQPATDAFNALDTAADPEALRVQLILRTIAVQQFTENLRTILQGGGVDLTAEIARLGVDGGQALADAIAAGGPQTIAAFETLVDGARLAGTEFNNFINNELAPQAVGDVSALATEAAAAFGVNFNPVPGAQGRLNEFNQFIADDDSAPNAAGFAGNEVGLSFDQGVSNGMREGTIAVQETARELVRAAEEAARDEAESDSPSRLFARIGQDMGEGVAIGFDQAAQAVVASAEGIVRDAAAAVAGTDLGTVNANIAGGGTGTVITIGTLAVSVTAGPGVTAEQAQAQGDAIAAGVVSGIEERTNAQIVMRGA